MKVRISSIINEMKIPSYPEFAPISLEMKDELYPSLNLISDGISEFTFSNLFLFRKTYGYKISIFRLENEERNNFIIDGSKAGQTFFYVPCALPPPTILEALMNSHDYLKNLSERQVFLYKEMLESMGYSIIEDRDNFDYLYLRTDLAELVGRDYHKKRNQVNSFLNLYECEQEELVPERVQDALFVLGEWKAHKESMGALIAGDYIASAEALEHFKIMGLKGSIYYIAEKPVAWCLGESVARGRMFAIHFEKALEKYKGIYQYINQAFAQKLPNHYKTINREQDLGDEGLRQAKMTYRPIGFVSKNRVVKA